MAHSLVSDSQGELQELSRYFELTDEREILEFLERHPAVAPLLLRIRASIRNYFGEDPVRLEVFYDPEWESEWGDQDPELFANIRTRLAPREALDRLHRFDHEWWYRVLEKTVAPVVVSIELIGGV